jgi:hypothetical protein
MTCKVTKNNKTQIHHNNHEKWQDFEDEAWQHLSRARKNNQGGSKKQHYNHYSTPASGGNCHQQQPITDVQHWHR